MENCYNIAEADASDHPKAPLDRIKGSWLAAGQTEGIKAVNFRCTSLLSVGADALIGPHF